MAPLLRTKKQTGIFLKRMLCQTGKKGKGPARKVRGAGQVQEDCEEFCCIFTIHSTFFLFSDHVSLVGTRYWCTLATTELRAV